MFASIGKIKNPSRLNYVINVSILNNGSNHRMVDHSEITVAMSVYLKQHSLKGFTLLEVMVTLLVLSVGLLGLAGLQLHALQYTDSSYQRTLVNIQALDMAERMWTHLDAPLTELAQWQRLNRDSLPQWQGTVAAVLNEKGDYIITISWGDQRFSPSDVFSFSYRLRLPESS